MGRDGNVLLNFVFGKYVVETGGMYDLGQWYSTGGTRRHLRGT
jgi:hypothetical protein